ncbi:hypothetical protein D3C81_2328040 [compost metagenome]
MIQHSHFYQCQGFYDPLSDMFVLLADFCRTGRMVVRQNDRSGVMLQGRFHHFAGMHLGMV